jgi:hypothetical protein
MTSKPLSVHPLLSFLKASLTFFCDKIDACSVLLSEAGSEEEKAFFLNSLVASIALSLIF